MRLEKVEISDIKINKRMIAQQDISIQMILILIGNFCLKIQK